MQAGATCITADDLTVENNFELLKYICYPTTIMKRVIAILLLAALLAAFCLPGVKHVVHSASLLQRAKAGPCVVVQLY